MRNATHDAIIELFRSLLSFDPERAYDTHGRGIAMANTLSFDPIEYRGKGNRVVTTLQFDRSA